MTRIELMTGPLRRRRWSDEQKRAVVAEAFSPGAVVSAVARRAEVVPAQIYRWRRELLGETRGFAEVMVTASRRTAGSASAEVSSGRAAIEIAMAGEVHVRIPLSSSPALAAAIVGALRQR